MFKKLFNLYKKYEEIVNYLIFGGLTTLVSVLSYALFTRIFSLSYLISNTLSWIFSVTFAYITNRYFVFKSKKKSILKECALFYLSRVTSLIAESILMYILIDIILLNDLIGKVISQIVVIILNYILSKIFVFKKNN